MNAVTLDNGKLTYGKVTKPKPTGGQVLVKMVASGVCHTDLHLAHGEIKGALKPHLVLGHEAVGEVEEVGENVEEFKRGDHILVPWLRQTCGKCAHCITGHETMCEFRISTGADVDGGYAEYLIANAQHAMMVPPELSASQAAPLACAGVTSYKALKDSGARPGQWVAVIGGAGGLGHLALQFANAMALKTICIDIELKDKCGFIKELGVNRACIFDGQDRELEQKVKALIAEGVHASIVLAPCASAYQQAMNITRRGGSVMCVALPKEPIALNFQDIVTKELRVQGSLVGDRQDLAEVLQFAADKKVHCCVTERNLKDAPKVLSEMAVKQVKGRVVLMSGYNWKEQGITKEACA